MRLPIGVQLLSEFTYLDPSEYFLGIWQPPIDGGHLPQVMYSTILISSP